MRQLNFSMSSVNLERKHPRRSGKRRPKRIPTRKIPRKIPYLESSGVAKSPRKTIFLEKALKKRGEGTRDWECKIGTELWRIHISKVGVPRFLPVKQILSIERSEADFQLAISQRDTGDPERGSGVCSISHGLSSFPAIQNIERQKQQLLL